MQWSKISFPSGMESAPHLVVWAQRINTTRELPGWQDVTENDESGGGDDDDDKTLVLFVPNENMNCFKAR